MKYTVLRKSKATGDITKMGTYTSVKEAKEAVKDLRSMDQYKVYSWVIDTHW